MKDERERAAGLSDEQFWHYYGRYPYLLAKAALWAGALAIVYWLFQNVNAVVFPVAVSFLIAYLLDPAVDWLESIFDRVGFLERSGASRTVAIFAFLIVIVMGLVGFVLVLYPALAKQIVKLVERLPELLGLVQTKLIPWVEVTFEYDVPADVSSAMDAYAGSVNEALPQIAQKVTQWAGGLITQTGAVVASLLNLVMIPLFSFYFLRDFDRMTEKLAKFVPVARHEWYAHRIHLMDDVVGEWFRGQVTVGVILAGLYGAGLGITFGVAEIGAGTGVAIGIMSGLLNIVPYFGFLIGFVLSVLMVLLDWTGAGPLIAVCAVFLVVQLLEGYIITPKIVGEKVGLSPVTVIIVLLLGGELFGLLGVLLAIPVAGVFRVLMPDMVAYYRQTPFYSGNYAVRVPSDDTEGLEEATDGFLDDDEMESEGVEAKPEPGPDVKRPVTAEHVKVTDRSSAPAVMDGGTDGDPEDEPPPREAQPVELEEEAVPPAGEEE